jgi:hypothetical protein
MRELLLLLALSLPAWGQKADLGMQVKGTLRCANEPALTGSVTSNAESCQPTGVGLSAAQQSTKYAGDFDWRQSPAMDLSSPGAKEVSLRACPSGVFGTWPGPSYYTDPRLYYVYIAGTGTPEAVKVTGGTCAGDKHAGTLQFTTVNAHAAGYTISSASSGIMEASIAAGVTLQTGNNFPYKDQGGIVVIEAGIHNLWAPLSFFVNDQHVFFAGGASVRCNLDDDCIRIGDPAHYQASNNIVLVNPSAAPQTVNGTHAMIVDFANHTSLYNVHNAMPDLVGYPSVPTFGYIVEVVGDQAFTLDGLTADNGVNVIRCDASFCGAHVYAPGPFKGHAGTPYTGGDNAAVGWLSHLEIGNCNANGVDWESGNGVHISDSVIQGYVQYGVRGGLTKGGYSMITIDNTHFEVGSCTNPMGNIGTAGVIINGGKVSIQGGEGPAAAIPNFANTGATQYRYWIVPHAPGGIYANLQYIGTASTKGSGNIQVTFADIPVMDSFDLLRETYPVAGHYASFAAPYGTGNFAVATGVTEASACVNGVCTVTDTQAALTSYTVPSVGWFPVLPFAVGQLVLGGLGGASGVVSAQASLSLNDLNAAGFTQNNVAGNILPAIDSPRCMTWIGGPLWAICQSSGAGNDAALLLRNGITNGGHPNLKGRLNFLTSSGPGHIVTLVDSHPEKTIGNLANYRPANDPEDTYIGCDSAVCFGVGATRGGLSFGSQFSISNYIGNVGDGTNWKERLTAKEKIFAVPVVINRGSTLTLGSGSAISQMRIYSTASVAAASVPAQSCIDVTLTIDGLTASDLITGLAPPKPLGNLSLNAFGRAANQLTLHFCNPTTAIVGIPVGVYSFLAVH